MSSEQLRYDGSTDFLEFLLYWQIIFETERVGSDGSLFDKNDVIHGLDRGVIGEAREALAEAHDLEVTEILTPDKSDEIETIRAKLHEELADVYIFLASVFVHAGMDYERILDVVQRKLAKNERKYRVSNFTPDRTIQESIDYSRATFRVDDTMGNRSIYNARESQKQRDNRPSQMSLGL